MNTTMIIGLTVALIILFYLAIQVFKLTKFFPNENFIAERKRKSDQRFFKRFANIKGTEFRTPTISYLILAGIAKTDQLVALTKGNIDGPTDFQRVGDTKIFSKPVLANRLTGNEAAINKVNEGDFDRSETDYAKFLEDLDIILGALCPCPGSKDKYCPWEPSMLKTFILDTSIINFISLQILYLDDTIISTSTYNKIISNDPKGTYVVVEMNNQDSLDALESGTIVQIVLKWTPIGSDTVCCITLLNEIPITRRTLDTNNQNGQLEVLADKQS